MAEIIERISNDEDPNASPEYGVGPSQVERALQPKQLVRMEGPGDQEHSDCSNYLGASLSFAAQFEVHRKIDDLDHEVFPVDVDPAPKIEEAAAR